MKFGIGVSNSRARENKNNIGDSIVDLAMRGIYCAMGIPEEDLVPINITNLSSYSGEHVIFPVIKGFPNYPRLSEAFSPAVHPVFLALAMYGDLDPADVPYLKQHEPIGCRDAYTLVQMQKYGISAYLNGCITVCLSPPPATGGGQVVRRGAKKVFLVDTEPELEAQIPPELLQKSVRETHAIAGDLHTSPLLEAERVLREYWEDAELVITSRLHAAVPCLSMGIPVILAKNIYSSRFAWVDRLIPVYQLEQYGEIDWNPKTVDLGELKSRVFDLVKARLWSAYQMATALREIHHFYSQRPEVPYETALSQTVPAIQSRFSPFASFTYAVWGITSMAESVVQYMQRTYPNAKLVHVYDKFRKLHFHGIETQTPDALLVQGDDLVIACPLSGSIAEQMSDFFHTEHFPEERFIVASDIV